MNVHVVTRSASMRGKFGTYRRIYVVELADGVNPSVFQTMSIKTTDKRIRKIHFDRVGSQGRAYPDGACQASRLFREANDLVASLTNTGCDA